MKTRGKGGPHLSVWKKTGQAKKDQEITYTAKLPKGCLSHFWGEDGILKKSTRLSRNQNQNSGGVEVLHIPAGKQKGKIKAGKGNILHSMDQEKKNVKGGKTKVDAFKGMKVFCPCRRERWGMHSKRHTFTCSRWEGDESFHWERRSTRR